MAGALSPAEIKKVAHFLVPIGDFKNVESDGYLVEALVHLWDPKCSAFRIGDYEITITVEEVAGLLNLLIRERLVRFPSTSSKAYFCTFTGLRKSAVPGPDDAASIDVKFLYDRFAIRSGFSTFRQDFGCSKQDCDGQRISSPG
jgi:hypothetical protein